MISLLNIQSSQINTFFPFNSLSTKGINKLMYIVEHDLNCTFTSARQVGVADYRHRGLHSNYMTNIFMHAGRCFCDAHTYLSLSFIIPVNFQDKICHTKYII